MRKNFVTWEDNGVLNLREIHESQMETIKLRSINQSYWNTWDFLLDVSYDIRDGVLYLKGTRHEDVLIRDEVHYRSVDKVFDYGSEEFEKLKEKYHIGHKYIGPLKKRKFSWLKFRMVTVFDKSKIYIKYGRYLTKEGVPQTIKTSNFKIKEHVPK